MISRKFLGELCLELKALTEKCRAMELKIKTLGKLDPSMAFLSSIPGVGPLDASTLRIELGDGRDFKNGRHFSNYLGLVPREHGNRKTYQ
ncbi:transposase [Vibrio quintilis]|uniref:transposase n=1 Tax=Vibrio quintilis TaxID=1117707 RepID=UPI000936B5C8|nr:transposase [Vibrio quintilis]